MNSYPTLSWRAWAINTLFSITSHSLFNCFKLIWPLCLYFCFMFSLMPIHIHCQRQRFLSLCSFTIGSQFSLNQPSLSFLCLSHIYVYLQRSPFATIFASVHRIYRCIRCYLLFKYTFLSEVQLFRCLSISVRLFIVTTQFYYRPHLSLIGFPPFHRYKTIILKPVLKNYFLSLLTRLAASYLFLGFSLPNLRDES